MAPRRNRTLALPLLGAAALAGWGSSSAFSVSSIGRLARTYTAAAPALGGRLASPRTRAAARGGAEAEADTIEVGGFSGFIVGLALIPHVVYATTVAFGVVANGAAFQLGPYGIQLVACATTVGLTIWSLGSFIERGRGLPAGPLGFLGLAEGISYLATLGLAIAAVVANTKSGALKVPEMPKVSAPTISAPASFKAPEVKVPAFKAPEFKAPDIKVPEIKAPKIPDIKVPEIKAPAVKIPEVKVPEVKVPEIKAPAKKEPEPPKKEPEKKEPEKKAIKAPTKPVESAPDYDSLFD